MSYVFFLLINTFSLVSPSYAANTTSEELQDANFTLPFNKAGFLQQQLQEPVTDATNSLSSYLTPNSRQECDKQFPSQPNHLLHKLLQDPTVEAASNLSSSLAPDTHEELDIQGTSLQERLQEPVVAATNNLSNIRPPHVYDKRDTDTTNASPAPPPAGDILHELLQERSAEASGNLSNIREEHTANTNCTDQYAFHSGWCLHLSKNPMPGLRHMRYCVKLSADKRAQPFEFLKDKLLKERLKIARGWLRTFNGIDEVYVRIRPKDRGALSEMQESLTAAEGWHCLWHDCSCNTFVVSSKKFHRYHCNMEFRLLCGYKVGEF